MSLGSGKEELLTFSNPEFTRFAKGYGKMEKIRSYFHRGCVCVFAHTYTFLYL